MNHWQPQEPLQYDLSSEKSHFGYYVTCTILHEKVKSKIIVTSRVDICLEYWWGCEFIPKLLAWDSELHLIKWNPLILVNPPTPNCAIYFCNSDIESYGDYAKMSGKSVHYFPVSTEYYVEFAKMAGKLIFIKGMVMHISENNDDLIFGYTLIPNKTHLEYKLLQNTEDQFKICTSSGGTDHTCANSFHSNPFKLKSQNDMLHILAIPHYS